MATAARAPSRRSAEANGASRTPAVDRFRILGSQQIPLSHLHPNPHNPRPSYHFDPTNPHIAAMADSLSVSGQHNPCKVYEIPDKPGYFMLVQGHRRFFAARIAREETLECLVVKAPKSLAEELDWVGSEDAEKQDWGPFSRMHYARELAKAYGWPLEDSRITAKTGLSRTQLTRAAKMFSLAPEIWAHVKAWEEDTYVKALPSDDVDTTATFPQASGIRVADFSPEKAAWTWDIYISLRENCEAIVRRFDDFTLQLKVARAASRDTLRNLAKLKALIDSTGPNPVPGALAQINTLLDDRSNRRIADVLHTTKNVYAVRLRSTTEKMVTMATTLKGLHNHRDQLGSDPEVLRAANEAMVTLLYQLERLHHEVDKQLLTRQARVHG